MKFTCLMLKNTQCSFCPNPFLVNIHDKETDKNIYLCNNCLTEELQKINGKIIKNDKDFIVLLADILSKLKISSRSLC